MPVPVPIETDPAYFGFYLANYTSSEDAGGPFEYNGFRYVGYVRVRVSDDVNFLTVAKTADNVNFTALDQANAPVGDISGLAAGIAADVDRYDSHTLVFIFATESSPTLKQVFFDMATDTWGTPSADGPTVLHDTSTGAIQERIHCCAKANGDVMALYPTGTISPVSEGLSIVAISAGVWATPLVVAAPAASQFVAGAHLIEDSGGRVHMLYILFTSPNSVVRHNYVTSGYTLGGATIVASYVNNFGPNIGIPHYDAANDFVGYPIVTDPGIFSFTAMQLVGIAPASGAFAITIETVHTFGGVDGDAFASFNFVGGTYYYWAFNFTTDVDEILQQWTRPASGGAWSGPTVIWDFNVDPPSPPQTLEFNWPINGVPLVDGTFATVMSFFVSACGTVWYLHWGTPTPPPTSGKAVPVYIKRRNLLGE